jgi:RNA polymerase sigma-70 factor (ECF subfamily)
MSLHPEDFGGCLSAARDGSREALGQTLQSCRRYLLSVARDELNHDLRAKGGASDLVQDTFLDAQAAFDRFRGNSEGELRAWLRRLLSHRAAKFGRRYRTTQKRRVEREGAMAGPAMAAGPSDAPTPSVALIADEQADRLRRALERLPEDYRRVVTLRYVEQFSFEEIGRRMGRTPNAARLLWLRAIERVRLELGSRDES